MAKGSEQLTWAMVGGKRPCDCCGRTITLEQVGEVRNVIADKKTYVWCTLCRGGKPQQT